VSRTLALALAPLLAYVIPGEVALQELVRRLGPSAPLRVEARLTPGEEDGVEPLRVVLELDPLYGVRASDEHGGRWLVAADRVVAGNAPAPAWLPQLEVLLLADEGALRGFLARNRIDARVNELGRCGAHDCFVLGGRRGPGQLWLDKDEFEVVRLVLPDQRAVEFGPRRHWGDGRGGPRFPAQIRVADALGRLSILAVDAVQRAPALSAQDFTAEWVDAAPAAAAP
jgi:hypothetical protein